MRKPLNNPPPSMGEGGGGGGQKKVIFYLIYWQVACLFMHDRLTSFGLTKVFLACLRSNGLFVSQLGYLIPVITKDFREYFLSMLSVFRGLSINPGGILLEVYGKARHLDLS